MSTVAVRKAARLLIGLLAVLLLVPGSAVGSSTRGRALTPVTVATIPVEPAALAYYARDKGFFRQQGIEAKFLNLSEPTQLVAALLSGEAQFTGLNVGGAAILKSHDAPVRLVAGGALYKLSAPTGALVAAPGRTISRARDLVGKRIAIDQKHSVAHISLLEWLKKGGVSADDVELVEIPFTQVLGPLQRGTVDAAVVPEPFLTLATERGAKPVARPIDAVCSQDCLLTFWMARRDVDANLAARFRNAMQAAAVWANQPRNDAASAAILANYVPIDKKVLAKMTRSRFASRLRPAMAQPWIDVYAEFGEIPASFRAIDLVK
jgi:NitT/TauT family transport system substrate-binding protein